MKSTYKKYILGSLLLLSLSSCVKDFVKINTNPNESGAAAPQSLLGPVIQKLVSANIDRNLRLNNELMQVTVTTNDNQEFHRYEVRPSESEYMWRSWYTQLTNIRDMYQKAGEAQQAGFKTYQGISLILDAWVSSMLTDMYGDVPYFESNLGYTSANTTPVFDLQEDIYQDLFLKLERANQLLKENIAVEANNADFDPLFATAPDKWRKFGNSLYLRLLLRVAHKAETNAIAKIQEIVNVTPAEYPIMTSNDDSAILRFQDQQPYLNPFSNARDIDFNGGRGYSEFFINTLIELQDPRLSTWSTEATTGVYAGMMSAYEKGAVPDRQSTLQLALKGKALLGTIMNYAELQFILAELALKGHISLEVDPLYKKAVESSISTWGKTIPETYFENPKIGLLPTDNKNAIMKKIQLQKYFALMFTDFQQWHEYRRTKALDLYIGPGVLNDGKMPVRLNYPLISQTLNKKNYDEAVARMGGDNINVQMWWQKGLD